MLHPGQHQILYVIKNTMKVSSDQKKKSPCPSNPAEHNTFHNSRLKSLKSRIFPRAAIILDWTADLKNICLSSEGDGKKSKGGLRRWMNMKEGIKK